MMRCSPEAFARCPTSLYCGSLADAVFYEGSECDFFNQEVEISVTCANQTKDHTREKLIEWISAVPYGPSPSATMGSLFPRSVITRIADTLITSGVVIQKWIPVSKERPALRMDTWEEEDGDGGTCEISDWVWGIDAEGKTHKVRYEIGPVFQGWYDEPGTIHIITHWMLPPAPPKEVTHGRSDC